ncbi:MAG: hypothetical protein Q4P36_00900 [Bowdeniella nasicola]|nr:hypothetical protein [Bowdeniella nasicola]
MSEPIDSTEPGSTEPAPRESGTERSADVQEADDPLRDGLRQAEEALRTRLDEDPNDQQAFATLARLVSVGAHYEELPDPLTAEELPADQRERINTAVWALADEYVGNSRAWYPLVQLARLSVNEDREAALRRLKTACEREDSGVALFESLQMLRRANLPGEAMQLGVGCWAPASHIPDAGRQLVRAACEAGRPAEAQSLLDSLIENAPEGEDFTDLKVAIQDAYAARG